jgi:hypothetical protein
MMSLAGVRARRKARQARGRAMRHHRRRPGPAGLAWPDKDRIALTASAPTGTTRTFAKTTARTSACTATTSWSSRPRPTTGRRRAHARRRSDRGRRDCALRRGDYVFGDGALRQRGAPRRRDRPRVACRPGEVARLYLTNTANTHVFKVDLPGARMKLVGGDSGRCEHEQLSSR